MLACLQICQIRHDAPQRGARVLLLCERANSKEANTPRTKGRFIHSHMKTREKSEKVTQYQPCRWGVTKYIHSNVVLKYYSEVRLYFHFGRLMVVVVTTSFFPSFPLSIILPLLLSFSLSLFHFLQFFLIALHPFLPSSYLSLLWPHLRIHIQDEILVYIPLSPVFVSPNS